jgi:hypothetical protein
LSFGAKPVNLLLMKFKTALMVASPSFALAASRRTHRVS